MRTMALGRMPARVEEKSGVAATERLVDLGPRAYQLAVRVLGSVDGAEDAVQQAYVNALQRMPRGLPPDEECAWFLRVVANSAKDLRRSQARRARREGTAMPMEPVAVGDAELRSEQVAVLREALEGLDEKYRLPVSLCYEQGLTQRQAALVLEMPETTMSKYLSVGLERLREIMKHSGYAAAPAAVIGGLAHTAPPVPTTLAAGIAKILAGGLIANGAGATATAVAKGGLAMKIVIGILAAGVLAGGAALFVGPSTFHPPPSTSLASPPTAYSLPPTGSNPVAGRQDREEVFEFAQKPTVTKQGDKVVIAFASKGNCDATVAIVDADGKIVRHLASGVLGKNAPWPFRQDSLSQSLEWDGKDDRGKPAPAGCQVRVGLGLKAAHDRIIGWEPRNVQAQSLNCDAEGNVYVEGNSSSMNCDPQVIVLDREGKYVRTAIPFPATGAPEKLSYKLTKAADGRAIPLTFRVGGGRYTGPLTPFDLPNRHTSLVTPDGKVMLMVDNGGNGRHLLRMSFDPAAPEIKVVNLFEKTWGEVQVGGVRGGRFMHLALSPDGVWIYFGSSSHPAARDKKDGRTAGLSDADHVVYRGKLADVLQGKLPQPFLGEVGKAGNDETHFNWPSGLACDAAGNLFVSDTGNSRIQVFSSEGKFLRSIPADKPEQLAVHPKTGAIYALRVIPPEMRAGGTHELFKLDQDGKPVAKMTLKSSVFQGVEWPGVFCLDASAEEPALWFSGGDGIVKIADRGDKLEKVLSLREEVAKASSEKVFVPGMTKIGLAVDPYRDEVYFPSTAGWVRIEGRTGKLLGKVAGGISEMCVGPDRLVYARLGGEGYAVVRYNPDDGKVVDFPKGTDNHKTGPMSIMGQKTKGIPIMAAGGGRTFQDGLCVAPNGDVWVILAEAHTDLLPELRKIGQGERLKPMQSNGVLNMNDIFVQVWGSDGAVKSLSAAPGLTRTANGIRVARNGKVCLVLNAHPAGQKVADGLDPKSPCEEDWGTLFSFDSSFDKFPIGVVNQPREGKPVTTPTHNGPYPLAVEGLRWQYGGCSPVTIGSCCCGNSRFDLDGFDRAFVPAMQTFTVNALDANGNLICRIGGYGNADSRGADSPVIDPKTGLLRPKRPTDPADLKPPKELAERIGLRWVSYVGVSDEAVYTHDFVAGQVKRLKLGYAAEETVPLP